MSSEVVIIDKVYTTAHWQSMEKG